MVVSCLLRKYHDLLYIVTTIFYFLLLGHVGPLPLSPCFSVLCQFFPSITPNILRSCLIRSSHRCLGFPFGRLFFGFHFVMGNNSWSSPSPDVSGLSYSLALECGRYFEFVKRKIKFPVWSSYPPSSFTHFDRCRLVLS